MATIDLKGIARCKLAVTFESANQFLDLFLDKVRVIIYVSLTRALSNI
jgi:hypothetical protein